MKDFQSLIKKQYKKKVVNHQFIDDKTIFHIFTRVIQQEYGQQGVRNIIPEYYTKNTIFLTFKQSIWAQEVWIHRQKLIDIVNEEVGKKILYNIKIKK